MWTIKDSKLRKGLNFKLKMIWPIWNNQHTQRMKVCLAASYCIICHLEVYYQNGNNQKTCAQTNLLQDDVLVFKIIINIRSRFPSPSSDRLAQSPRHFLLIFQITSVLRILLILYKLFFYAQMHQITSESIFVIKIINFLDENSSTCIPLIKQNSHWDKTCSKCFMSSLFHPESWIFTE